MTGPWMEDVDFHSNWGPIPGKDTLSDRQYRDIFILTVVLLMIIQFSVEISVTGYRQIQETGAHRTHMKLVFCRPLMKKQIIETSDNHIPVRTLTTGLQPFSRKEFHVHSGEVLSSHEEVNWIST